ncbi:hypothetical protein [Psychrobacillus sp. L3]|uniref:hypothetical protein n=1 Tax=Psychrobacillus sp. L3 TaxID=3236891 RepID=UPI0036F217BA
MGRERIGLIVSIIGILLITLGVLYPLNYISHQTYSYNSRLGIYVFRYSNSTREKKEVFEKVGFLHPC